MRFRCLFVLAGLSVLIPSQVKADEIKASFNKNKAILPSTFYTPDQPYTAEVWVVKGERYADANYNMILGVPSQDAAGREWYEPAYNTAEESSSIDWSIQRAPFSSDASYLGQTSYKWADVDIMGEMYMRRTFKLTPEELPAGAVYLACGHDDAPAEWYINGVQVHTVSDGWQNEEYILLTDEQKNLLKTDGSDNLLAVHVHQNWGGAFADCGLYEADMSMVKTFLSTVADGSWPCAYYMLNYNSDFGDAEREKWYSPEEDESDWIKGVGPFSNDRNIFYITEWPSQVRPILVRRHFTLTADELARIDESELTFSCSYDEEPIAYLNGEKIWSATGWNDNNYATMIFNEDKKKLLKEGDNVLAMSLRQGAGGGHVDYGLFIESPYIPENPGTSGVTDAETMKIRDNRIYNLQGQYVGTSLNNLSNGLYIQNGKKILINK